MGHSSLGGEFTSGAARSPGSLNFVLADDGPFGPKYDVSKISYLLVSNSKSFLVANGFHNGLPNILLLLDQNAGPSGRAILSVGLLLLVC